MMADLISPTDYMTDDQQRELNKSVRQHEMDKLQARIERLERFIMQSYDWPAMLTESNLSDTIRHTVDQKMWVDISATLRGGD